MPKVPQLAEQVDIAPIPGVRLTAAPTAETFGAGIKQTIDQVGLAVYTRAVREEDDAAIQHAATNLNKAAIDTQLLVEKLRGKEALGGTELVEKEWEKHQKTALNSLNSDRQRKEVTHLAQTRYLHLYQFAQEHGFKEHNAYKDQEDLAYLQASTDLVRLNADNPFIVEEQKKEQERVLTNKAERKSVTGTPLEAAWKAAALSRTNTEVVTGLLMNGMDMKAKDYYEANKNHFTHEDRDTVDGLVLEGSTRGQARRLTDSLIQQHGINTPEQRQALFDDINKNIENPKVADQVRQRVEHEISSFDQLAKAQAERNFLNASKMIEETWQSTNKPVRDIIPVDVWNSLTPNEQSTLEQKLARLRTPVRPHDPEAWFRFNTMTSEELAQIPPAKLMKEFLNKFDDSHYDRGLTHYNAAINVKAKKDSKTPDEKFVSALTTRERIRNSFNLSGVAKDPKKLTTEEAIWFDRYETAADKALSVLPKDASPEQIDKVLSGLSDSLLKQKYTVDPGIFRFKKDVPAIGMQDVKDPRSVRVPLKEIPPDRQNALRGALKQAGVAVTDQAIEELEAKSRLKRQGLQ